MLSLIRHWYTATIEPIQAIHVGAVHFETLVEDESERRSLQRLKIGTEGMLSVSSYLVYASLLPLEQDVKKSLLQYGCYGLTLGAAYATPLLKDFLKYGREEISRQKRLQPFKTQP